MPIHSSHVPTTAPQQEPKTTARTRSLPPPLQLCVLLRLVALLLLASFPSPATATATTTPSSSSSSSSSSSHHRANGQMPASLKSAAAAAANAAATACGSTGSSVGKEGPLRAFTIVVAATQGTRGIGKEGKLPWNLPEDMAHFKRVTTTTKSGGNAVNAVIMGRKTWQSIPERFRPLRDRLNVVLSRNPAAREQLDIPASVKVYGSLREALRALAQGEEAARVEKVFIIGGATVYQEALQSFPAQCEAIEYTRVDAPADVEGGCDAHFPPLPADGSYALVASSETLTQNGVPFCFQRFERAKGATATAPAASAATTPAAAAMEQEEGGEEGNVEEEQYLALVREIIEKGNHRGDRTQTGTLSRFGAQLRFSLRGDTFPLLTTKRVFWRGVAEELLWFISGKTDANLLKAKKIGIWDGNSSREYLDSLGLTHREEGDLGPVYGFQWRHFGAEYVDMHADYAGKGIDQLARAIQTIKSNPEDRRIIVSAWNPADLSKMALPPCHMFCQFYVANGELSCQMYQRSADMGLGVPFNIASYALLTRLVAQVCDLKPGEFVHTIGDAHVYLNHVDALKEQLKRRPRPFPKLRINPAKKDIDSFAFEDFTIEGYDPHETIKMKMAV